MGIFSRLNTVIRSNLNALVDRAEDPEKMIQQTVLDMKEEVKRARQELVSTLGTSKRLEKKKLELETELASWEEKAVLALRSGDESLAREALKRKAKTKKDAEEAGRQAAMAATAADQMQATLDKVEQKIRDLETRQSSLAAQVRKAREAPSAAPGSERFGGSAFDELERMTGRIDQLEAEVEVHGVLDDPKRAEVDAQFRTLEKSRGDDAVEDELSALKKRLGS